MENQLLRVEQVNKKNWLKLEWKGYAPEPMGEVGSDLQQEQMLKQALKALTRPGRKSSWKIFNKIFPMLWFSTSLA